MVFNISPKNSASSRTKNRIRENGPRFFVIKEGFPQCFAGKNAILLESLSTEWFGWLPTEELETVTEEEC